MSSDTDNDNREMSSDFDGPISSETGNDENATMNEVQFASTSSELSNDRSGPASISSQSMNDSNVPIGSGTSLSSSSESLRSISSNSTFEYYRNDDDDDDDNDDDDEDTENWLNKLIYSEATVSGGNALCQILKVYVSNRLSKKALEDMLETIDLLLPNDHILPKTKYKLLKLINKILPHSNSDFAIKHRICSECQHYFGKWSEVEAEICPRCNCTELNSFFLQFNLESELRNAFEVRDLQTLMNDFRDECASRNAEDLYDLTSGSEYRRLKLTTIPGQYDLCLIWFTDGVQVSKSGKSNIWPIFAQIANIAPKFRRSFQFVCGLFYSPRCIKKPNMNSYLQPFQLELEKLYTNGFEWRHRTLNDLNVSKVIAPLACLDAPAKAAAQNLMQYNGENGCSTCEATGESCETGAGSNWIFPIVPPENCPLRSAERMEKQTSIVERFENLKHFKGVKGKSIVTSIPHFDRSKGFVADYMHAVLLGVMLMLLSLWCNSNNHEKDYYLPKQTRDEIDNILKSIKPPTYVTRTPRKLTELQDWKASELRAFLLYYGPIVLMNRLANVYYEHFLLLVQSIYILSSEKINATELDLSETLLNIFVIDMEKLYGRNKCSYNVHQLLHIPQHVREWGPLWVWSAFLSEDQNGELVSMVHGSNKIDVELSNTIKIIQAYRSIKYLMHPEIRLNHFKFETHGPSTAYDFTHSDLQAINYATQLTAEQLLEVPNPVYSRCKINDEIFTSELYTRQKKRENFYVQWKDGETLSFGGVKFFLKIGTSLYAVLHQLVISNIKSEEIKNREIGFNLNRFIIHTHNSYCIHAIPVEKITSKVLLIENYVCIFANDVERK